MAVTKPRVFACAPCGFLTTLALNLSAHLRDHHHSTINDAMCAQWERLKAFKRESIFVDSLLAWQDEYSCQICSKKCNSLASMESHWFSEEHIKSARRSVCDDCFNMQLNPPRVGPPVVIQPFFPDNIRDSNGYHCHLCKTTHRRPDDLIAHFWSKQHCVVSAREVMRVWALQNEEKFSATHALLCPTCRVPHATAAHFECARHSEAVRKARAAGDTMVRCVGVEGVADRMGNLNISSGNTSTGSGLNVNDDKNASRSPVPVRDVDDRLNFVTDVLEFRCGACPPASQNMGGHGSSRTHMSAYKDFLATPDESHPPSFHCRLCGVMDLSRPAWAEHCSGKSHAAAMGEANWHVEVQSFGAIKKLVEKMHQENWEEGEEKYPEGDESKAGSSGNKFTKIKKKRRKRSNKKSAKQVQQQNLTQQQNKFPGQYQPSQQGVSQGVSQDVSQGVPQGLQNGSYSSSVASPSRPLSTQPRDGSDNARARSPGPGVNQPGEYPPSPEPENQPPPPPYSEESPSPRSQSGMQQIYSEQPGQQPVVFNQPGQQQVSSPQPGRVLQQPGQQSGQQPSQQPGKQPGNHYSQRPEQLSPRDQHRPPQQPHQYRPPQQSNKLPTQQSSQYYPPQQPSHHPPQQQNNFRYRQPDQLPPQQPGQYRPQQPDSFSPQQPGQYRAQQLGQLSPQQPGQLPRQQPGPYPQQPGPYHPQQPDQYYPPQVNLGSQQPGQKHSQQPGQLHRQQTDRLPPQQPGQPAQRQPYQAGYQQSSKFPNQNRGAARGKVKLRGIRGRRARRGRGRGGPVGNGQRGGIVY
eukprot:258982_1